MLGLLKDPESKWLNGIYHIGFDQLSECRLIRQRTLRSICRRAQKPETLFSSYPKWLTDEKSGQSRGNVLEIRIQFTRGFELIRIQRAIHLLRL